MMPRTFSLLAFALALLPALHAASPAQIERIGASFLFALGRAPSAEETTAWTAHGAEPLAALIDRHRESLRDDADLRRATATRAAQDAFGRAPAPAELDTPSGADPTYAALVQAHLARLASQPDEYRAVLARAYGVALRRAAHDEEYAYWAGRDVQPHALLVACIENWARRNAPGLMSTTGTPSASINSAWLTTLRLSPAIADEARAFLALVPPATAPHRYIVAPGATDIASVGGIHFVATGGPSLTAALGD